MKKILLILFCVSFFTVNAQSKRDGQFSIIGGLHNSSNKRTLESVDLKSVSDYGFYFGFSGDFSLSEKWGVQPEIMITLTSFKYESRHGQVIMPIMLEYNIAKRFELQFGPYVDYNGNVTVNENALGVGMAFGVEAKVMKRVKARARYYAGFSNRFQNNPTDNVSKFNYFQIGLSYDLFR